MTHATFQELLNQFCPYLEWQATTMRLSLPLETQPAIALLKQAKPTSLHYISHLFGTGKANAGPSLAHNFRGPLSKYSFGPP